MERAIEVSLISLARVAREMKTLKKITLGSRGKMSLKMRKNLKRKIRQKVARKITLTNLLAMFVMRSEIGREILAMARTDAAGTLITEEIIATTITTRITTKIILMHQMIIWICLVRDIPAKETVIIIMGTEIPRIIVGTIHTTTQITTGTRKEVRLPTEVGIKGTEEEIITTEITGEEVGAISTNVVEGEVITTTNMAITTG